MRRSYGLVVAALFLTSCVCSNRQVDFVLSTEAEQVLRLVPDGADRVKVIVVGSAPWIYYYGAGEPTYPGYPDQVRFILTWDKNDPPKFDRVLIAEKGDLPGSARGLLGGVDIASTDHSKKSGRVRRKPDADQTRWRYQIVVKRGGETVGMVDPDIVIIKDRPTG